MEHDMPPSAFRLPLPASNGRLGLTERKVKNKKRTNPLPIIDPWPNRVKQILLLAGPEIMLSR
jgi:hypothetical protein